MAASPLITNHGQNFLSTKLMLLGKKYSRNLVCSATSSSRTLILAAPSHLQALIKCKSATLYREKMTSLLQWNAT
ncbi:hypothetical protein EGR_06202 [Echinococcus granulosus]|uniref:Uncharacterized protein n=1 Tax=Echinococcus granulosus TaxID=6210 RepID=W6UDB6_ECHGR|nr:hypothetical protein EGR_06202 [Echinococcus granulosus]EUB58983.1 hypothetical protein EGR_06202 [Echinococcus granulosus]